jgi:hypothetical protein
MVLAEAELQHTDVVVQDGPLRWKQNIVKLYWLALVLGNTEPARKAGSDARVREQMAGPLTLLGQSANVWVWWILPGTAIDASTNNSHGHGGTSL